MNLLTEEKKQKILELITDSRYSPMKSHELAEFFEIPKDEREELNTILKSLVNEGVLVETKKGKYMPASSLNMFRGRFIGNNRGFGFVDIEGENDVFIPAHEVNGAIHNDIVLCKIISQSSDGRKCEGEIVRIIERKKQQIIGTFDEQKKGFGFVIPDDKHYSKDIFVSAENARNAVSGHKVIVKITKNQEENRNPEGIITEIIGHKNDPGVDVLSIVIDKGIPFEYPKQVILESENVVSFVDEKSALENGRVDFRSDFVITIDGADAKDLDDAVSLSKTEAGYRLSVHIADVTHYVKSGSETDIEALNRGTSVYLADRVIPMLPHVLSNGICSLNPNENRMTLSCVMDINFEGRVVSHKICEGIIKTIRRMTYEDVNEILTDHESKLREEYSDTVKMIEEMDELREILWNKRVKRGAIEFGLSESKIIVDEAGKAIGIEVRERNKATNLIEEFMLVCNETVAEEAHWAELPFIYRTHEEPDEEKLKKLDVILGSFGLQIKSQDLHPKALQELLLKLQGKEEEGIISRLILRSLKQARYTVTNEGHFGLASKQYCHFTSPIRRYPDLMIHRILKDHVNGRIDEQYLSKLSEILPEISKKCSTTERRAEDCEREVENLKKVEFMLDKVGMEFSGVISGVTSWGIYVELENSVEGMVSANDLDDDIYSYDEAGYRYVGKRSKKTISLGDKVKIIVAKANLNDRRLDFVFV